MSQRERYIGLMSGTSADGVDAVVAVFENGRYSGLQGAFHLDYPPALRDSLIALGRAANATLSLREYARLDVAVGEVFAEAALGVLRSAGLAAADIVAIGSHGQTVFHDPRGAHSSLQIGDPNRIAARTGCLVVADFRRADIALGGEGAPLVPAFHHAVFAASEPRTVVNVGGIANVTWLPGTDSSAVRGFDCGPGNGLMDEWILRVQGRPYDEDGRLAASGCVNDKLLQAWLSDAYFGAPPPKSTGRAQFNLDWARHLAGEALERLSAADVQASLCELTARSIVDALAPGSRRALVCGGGARNLYLMDRLQTLAPAVRFESSAAHGLPPEWVEAAAFAWLARRRLNNEAGNLPAVTGAQCATPLGAVFQVAASSVCVAP
ncbi:MAG: anhydro-N-acetylmuramic acid kinase [Nevskiaceae bacterium]|nr:MAG: anhydro-N-acetylmuramic acid kinase [Nevskiaceae bacterium]TAM28611.1 MAG: anhydro-N-acetylmuramic acid kinase [Nevskiaceae bacterium]